MGLQETLYRLAHPESYYEEVRLDYLAEGASLEEAEAGADAWLMRVNDPIPLPNMADGQLDEDEDVFPYERD